jgi:hypothetical protein
MTPEQLVANATALFQALMGPGGLLGAVVGTIVFSYGKIADSPMAVSWGKKAWMGAAVPIGGTAVIGLVQNVATRIFG